MTTEFFGPEPAPQAEVGISFSRVHSFLATRGIEFGSLAGTQYDREITAPHFVDFIMEESAARGQMDEKYARGLGRITKAMLGRFYAIRQRNMTAYRSFEQRQLPVAIRMSQDHPVIGISIELAHVLEDTDMSPVADDITVAISQVLGRQTERKPS